MELARDRNPSSAARAVAVLALLAGLLASVEAAAQTAVEGHGKGTLVRSAALGRPVALLDRFFFRFGPPLERPSDVDHHLRTIQVAPARPLPGQLTVTFSDRKADDPYGFSTSFYGWTGLGIVTGEIDSGENVCPRVCVTALERPSPDHVFVLRGFELEADRDDAHVQRIGIFEDDGDLVVAVEAITPAFFLSPASFFHARVEYAYLPASAVLSRGTVRGSARGGDEAAIPAGESVIRGFDLRFVNGPHHLREVGVATPDDGHVEVFFADDDADDPIVWSVDWALLGRDPGVVVDPG